LLAAVPLGVSAALPAPAATADAAFPALLALVIGAAGAELAALGV
jgi:hypothetical protein